MRRSRKQGNRHRRLVEMQKRISAFRTVVRMAETLEKQDKLVALAIEGLKQMVGDWDSGLMKGLRPLDPWVCPHCGAKVSGDFVHRFRDEPDAFAHMYKRLHCPDCRIQIARIVYVELCNQKTGQTGPLTDRIKQLESLVESYERDRRFFIEHGQGDCLNCAQHSREVQRG